MELKEKLIQLGEEHPDLKDNLRVILDHITGKSTGHPETDKHQNKQVKKLKTPKSEKGLIFSTCPEAYRAFEKVILPQIESRIDTFSFDDLSKMMDEIELLGQSKNVELENSLIVHKPVSMNTRRFYQEVQEVFKEWIRPRLKGNSSGKPNSDDSDSGDSKKEYNFNFS